MGQTAILIACAAMLLAALVRSLYRRMDAARHRNEPTVADLMRALNQLRYAISSLHTMWEQDRRERYTRVVLPVKQPPQTDRKPAKNKSAKAR